MMYMWIMHIFPYLGLNIILIVPSAYNYNKVYVIMSAFLFSEMYERVKKRKEQKKMSNLVTGLCSWACTAQGSYNLCSVEVILQSMQFSKTILTLV